MPALALAPMRLDLGGHRIEPGAVDVDQRELGAFVGEGERGGAADAERRTGDQHGLSSEIGLHFLSPDRFLIYQPATFSAGSNIAIVVS